MVFFSPPTSPVFWTIWERPGVGGIAARWVPRLVALQKCIWHEVGLSRRVRSTPSSRPSPPRPQEAEVLGERENACGDLDPGRVRSSDSARCPGLMSVALTGRWKEAAASCRCSFKNIQSPVRNVGERNLLLEIVGSSSKSTVGIHRDHCWSQRRSTGGVVWAATAFSDGDDVPWRSKTSIVTGNLKSL